MNTLQESLKKPVLFFIISASITFLLFAFVFTVSNNLFEKKNDLLKNQASIERLSTEVIYFDEVLTMSARLAAATGNSVWEVRYNLYVPKLDSVIKKIRNLSFDAAGIHFLEKIDSANNALIDLERQAFEYIHEGRLDEARNILRGEEYKRFKTVYTEGVTELLNIENSNVKNLSKHHDEKIKQTIAVFALVLFICWMIALAAIRKHLIMRWTIEKRMCEDLEKLVKEKTEELIEAQQIIENAEEFSLVMKTHIGLDGRWLKVPQRLCKLLGYSSEELLSSKCMDQTHPDDIATDLHQCQQLIDGVIQSCELEKRYISKSSEIIWAYLNCSMVKDKNDTPVHFLTYIQDISEKKKIEGERDQLLQMKTNFLATAAHELRTPLTTIRGFSELILNRDDWDDQKRKKYVRYINEESESLTEIVDDLLDVTRIESGQASLLCLSSNDLVGAVEREIGIYREHIECFDFRIVVEGKPEKYFFDQPKISQVLRNLYSNAVKYCAKSKLIETKVDFGENHATVSISDHGIGMSEEARCHLFDKFFRAKEVGAIKGTGLGMTIVKYIIEQHGGEVWVDSELGKGTTVHFTIPKDQSIRA